MFSKEIDNMNIAILDLELDKKAREHYKKSYTKYLNPRVPNIFTPNLEEIYRYNFKLSDIMINNISGYKYSLLKSNPFILKGNYNLDHKKRGRVGIDRFKLYVELKSIDSSKFQNLTSYRLKKNDMHVLDIATGKPVAVVDLSHIKSIKNPYNHDKNLICYGLKITKRNLCYSRTDTIKCELDITAPVALYKDCNIYNVNPNKILNLLKVIQSELKKDGLSISYENSELFYLEINKNILASKALYHYYNILKFIADKILKGKIYPEKQEEITDSMTLTIDNLKHLLNLYDKSAELINRYNFNPGYHLYRLEIKLKSKDNIKRFLKSNNLDVFENQLCIDSLFNDFINNKFIIPIKEYLSNQVSDLSNLITSTKFKHLENVCNVKNGELFDVELFGLAMSYSYNRLGNETNFARDFKNLLSSNKLIESKFNQLDELEYLLSIISEKKITLDDIRKKKNIKTHIQKHINKN